MSERKDRRQESRDLKHSPSVSTLLAPASQGDHVFRLQLQSHTNHKYVQVEFNNVIVAKNDAAGPDTIFELHRFSVPAPPSAVAFSASSPSFVTRYAIRSPFGKFINVDENIELLLKDRANKDTGIKSDRDGSSLTDREKLFELIAVKNKDGQTNIALRAQDDIFLTVDPSDGKFKVAKSASYTAIIAAQAAAATAAAAASANAAPLSPSASSAPTATPTTSPALPSYSPLTSELFTPIWLDDRSPLSLSGRFALRTAHDKYVCIEPAGKVIANRGELSVWEPLELLSVSLTQVAFQTVHGTYLSLDHTSPRLVLEAASLAIGANEKFTYEEIDADKGIFAFRSSNGLYVCAQGNHSVTGSSSTRGPWESFRLVPVTADQ